MITSYEDMSVGKYEALQQAVKDPDDNTRNLAVLSVLTGRTIDDLLDMTLAKIRALTVRAGFINHTPNESPVRRRYKVGGRVLIPVLEQRKMTAAQYIDFQTFAKHPDGKLAEMVSCFLVPKGKRYNNDYDIVEVQQTIRDQLPVTEALGLLAFFLDRYKRSTLNTLLSSISVMRREEKKTRDPRKKIQIMEARMATERIALSVHFGDGWPTSMSYRK